MHQHRSILALSLCVILYSTVQIYAQLPPAYTLTDLGAFQPNAIAGPWVVGSENGRAVRLNLDTMQKSPLPDPWGVGSVANAVLSSGVVVGTVKNPQGLDSAA